jgi:hypothetical protein
MANPNEPDKSVPPTEVRPPSDRRADKGMRKTGFWAIVLGVLLLGIVAVALEVARPAETDEGVRNPDEVDAGTITPR